jgi:ribosomal protein L37E
MRANQRLCVCPRCGLSSTSYSGSYCQQCGEPLLEAVRRNTRRTERATGAIWRIIRPRNTFAAADIVIASGGGWHERRRAITLTEWLSEYDEVR